MVVRDSQRMMKRRGSRGKGAAPRDESLRRRKVKWAQASLKLRRAGGRAAPQPYRVLWRCDYELCSHSNSRLGNERNPPSKEVSLQFAASAQAANRASVQRFGVGRRPITFLRKQTSLVPVGFPIWKVRSSASMASHAARASSGFTGSFSIALELVSKRSKPSLVGRHRPTLFTDCFSHQFHAVS